MSSKSKNYYLSLSIDLLKTLLISFVMYFAVATLLAAILEEEENAVILRTIVSTVFYVIYYFSFHFMYARKDIENYSLNMTNRKYSFKSDIADIIKNEGKKLAIVYGILAAVFELCKYIPITKPLRAFLLPMFPIAYLINIPVLSSILGWVAVVALSILTIANGHRSVHVKKEKGKL